MLDHLSRAFHTFPIFPLVGLRDTPIRPAAVEEVTRILEASLVEGRLARQTIAVTGPEEMSCGEAVRRVARAAGKRPLFFRLPVLLHSVAAHFFERLMAIPLVSVAQVRILSEGVAEPLPPCPPPPQDLAPRLPFTEEQIRKGLPEPEVFSLKDCRLPAACGRNLIRRRG